MTDPVLARLTAIKTTPTPKLREQWRLLFDSEPPPSNRRYTESRLAYRIQELAYGARSLSRYSADKTFMVKLSGIPSSESS